MKKCQDSWFIHVSSYSVFYTEPCTGKRIVGERVGWSQHPWNMNISSSFSHHQQTNTHTHTHTRAGFPRGLRATVVLISRQVNEGLAGYSPGSSPRDMRCCMVIRQTLSLTERKREGVRERERERERAGGGGHHGRWWNLDTTESPRGLTKRSRTQARDLFSPFYVTSGHSWKKWHLLSSSRKSQDLRSKAFHFWCFLHHPVAF